MLSLLFFSVLAHASILDGSWQTNCAQNVIREEVFQGSLVSLFEKNYQDQFCATPSVEIENVGTYILDATVLPANHSIDFTFSAVFITLHSEDALHYYNAHQLCGLADWSLDVRREITGLACDFFATGTLVPVPQKGDMRFGIYQLSGDQLFFGLLTPAQDGLSETARPTSLDLNPYWRLKE